MALIRAGETDVCEVATEPLASHATIRTGAAKIDTDALLVYFRIFGIIGLLIVRREAVASLCLGGGSFLPFRETGERHSASIEPERTGRKDQAPMIGIIAAARFGRSHSSALLIGVHIGLHRHRWKRGNERPAVGEPQRFHSRRAEPSASHHRRMGLSTVARGCSKPTASGHHSRQLATRA